MLRVSVTHIEEHRRYLADMSPESDLLKMIRGERFVRRPQAIIGDALHRVLESPHKYEQPDGSYLCDGVALPGDLVAPCLAIFDPRGTFECKTTQQYAVKGESVTVVAKADQLLGLAVIENKFTFSRMEPFGRFFPSMQWRFYLDIWQAVSVTYNVFPLCEEKDGTLGLYETPTSFSFHPYPSLHDECTEALEAFVEYADARQLRPFLAYGAWKNFERNQPQQATEAAA